MKKIAITMGDPGGIGPEVIVKSLNKAEVLDCCSPLVIGNCYVMENALKLLNIPLQLRVLQSPEESNPSPGRIEIIDEGEKMIFKRRKATVEGGFLSVACIKKAVKLAVEGQVDAVVTAPISKESLKMAGLPWPGHTELLAELTHSRDYAMMLVGRMIRVILVTIHMPLRKVPDYINKDSVLRTIRLAKKACDMLEIYSPRIAVAALNPHAGESGIFGDEENAHIKPAVAKALSEGIPVEGPFPPDTVFHRAYKGEIDIVVCMYHDQGLIPLKMIAFDEGVNITVGLPIIRTSPDHGTAYDIAWSGKANPASMLEAIKLAARLRV